MLLFHDSILKSQVSCCLQVDWTERDWASSINCISCIFVFYIKNYRYFSGKSRGFGWMRHSNKAVKSSLFYNPTRSIAHHNLYNKRFTATKVAAAATIARPPSRTLNRFSIQRMGRSNDSVLLQSSSSVDSPIHHGNQKWVSSLSNQQFTNGESPHKAYYSTFATPSSPKDRAMLLGWSPASP